MPAITLPSGQILNPISISSVTKQKHFFGDEFYLIVSLRRGSNIEIEHLSTKDADALLNKIKVSIDSALEAANLYEEQRSDGYSDGCAEGKSDGHKEGYAQGYQEAHNKFWSYEREEYRINEYHIGYESGKQDGQSNGWSDGYSDGKKRLKTEAQGAIEDAESEILERIKRNFPVEANFGFEEITIVMDMLSQTFIRHLNSRSADN